MRVFGFVVRWGILAALGLYFVAWIPPIMNVQFAQLTLAQVFSAIFGFCALGGVGAWAFREGEKSYDVWASIGVAVLVLAAFWARYFSN